MPTINATREKYFFQFIGMTPPAVFQHQPAASKPTPPVFPDTLTAPQIAAFLNWRDLSGPPKATAYAALTGATLTKADAFIAFYLLRNAWLAADDAARRSQYAWHRADAAISNYDAVPPSANNAGTGSGSPSTPQTKQEPV